jgi:hypothetical protein
LHIVLSQKKNSDWLFNDSMPVAEEINIGLDEAQMVNCKAESD